MPRLAAAQQRAARQHTRNQPGGDGPTLNIGSAPECHFHLTTSMSTTNALVWSPSSRSSHNLLQTLGPLLSSVKAEEASPARALDSHVVLQCAASVDRADTGNA